MPYLLICVQNIEIYIQVQQNFQCRNAQCCNVFHPWESVCTGQDCGGHFMRHAKAKKLLDRSTRITSNYQAFQRWVRSSMSGSFKYTHTGMQHPPLQALPLGCLYTHLSWLTMEVMFQKTSKHLIQRSHCKWGGAKKNLAIPQILWRPFDHCETTQTDVVQERHKIIWACKNTSTSHCAVKKERLGK